MEQEQNNQVQQKALSQESPFVKTSDDREIMQEILKNTRQTKNYLKWQLYITVILVVLPLLAMIFIIPMVLRSLGGAYGGLVQ